MSSLRYGGITYAVEAKKDGSATIKASGKIDLALTYRPAAGKSFKATAKDARGQTLRTLEASVDENGEVVVDLTEDNERVYLSSQTGEKPQ